MKILHVIPDLSTIAGGPVEAVKNMAKYQTKLGNAVSIITTDFYKPNNLVIKNVKISYFKCSINFIRYSYELKKYLSKNIKNFDIVHIHTIWQYPTYIVGKICLKNHVPYILRPCGMLDDWSFSQKKLKKFIYYSLYEKRTIKNASAVHCTSKAETEEAQKYLQNKNIFILPLSVDTLFKKASFNNTSKKYILYLSRLHYKKQPDLLIKAFSKLVSDYPNHQLILAGPCETKYKYQLEKIIISLNLKKKITFAGMVIGEQKNELLLSASIYVLPSLQENFGIAVAEAMGAGLPVIIGEKVALAKDVINHNAGMVIKPTVDNIANAIKELLSSSEQSNAMGKNGYEFVKNNLSGEAIAKQLIYEYKKIVNNY